MLRRVMNVSLIALNNTQGRKLRERADEGR
jgi:hypothetical protein